MHNKKFITKHSDVCMCSRRYKLILQSCSVAYCLLFGLIYLQVQTRKHENDYICIYTFIYIAFWSGTVTMVTKLFLLRHYRKDSWSQEAQSVRLSMNETDRQTSSIHWTLGENFTCLLLIARYLVLPGKIHQKPECSQLVLATCRVIRYVYNVASQC